MKTIELKRFVLTALILMMGGCIYAQGPTTNAGSYQQTDYPIRTFRIYPIPDPRYFLKLNTRTGQIWPIAFDEKVTKQLEATSKGEPLVNIQNEVDNRFALYPTQNTWVYLLLDQINGKMWQMEWHIKTKKAEMTPLNGSSLIDEQQEGDIRFILQSTRNMWHFLLLDQINGNMWHIGWSLKSKGRSITPIN
ncbi:hypothetical protein [Dyadobacter jejuensis]|uniref:hypothetical protein n=1 Tax=Dyadobacter jejuensis TaxID=1082580 RepID=UPI0011B2973D|nr:hypothetical protein [Dyadobacter jejuensis]